MDAWGGGGTAFTYAREGCFRMFSNGVVILRAFKGGKEASELVDRHLQTVFSRTKKIRARAMFSAATESERHQGREGFSCRPRSKLWNR